MSIAGEQPGLLQAVGDTVVLPCAGYGTVGIQIVGTFSGTILPEGTVDGITWQTVNATKTNSTSAVVSFTGAGIWTASVAGMLSVRLRASAFASGAANCKLLTSLAAGGGSSSGGSGGGDATAANQLLEIADLDIIAVPTLDYDTGAGSDPVLVRGIALPASGGAVAGGTLTNPIRVDPTGTTTQPVTVAAGSAVIGHVITDTGSTTAVTGNVTVVQPTGTNLHVVTDSGTITTVSAVTAITNALPAGSNVIGHVIADTGSTTAVTGNVTAVQPTGTNLHVVTDSGTITTVSTVSAVTAITNALPAGTNVIGHVIADSGSTTAVTQATAANLNAAVVGTGTAGTAAGGVLTIQGVAAMTKLLVTPDSVALPANQSVNVAQINGVTATMDNGASGTGVQRVTIANNSTGVVGLNAGTNTIGGVTPVASAAGGATTMNASSSDGATALTSTAQVIKASAGTLYGVYIYNPNTVVIYVQFYNVAQASVTVGTTNPLFMLAIPPLSPIGPTLGGVAGVLFSNAGWSWAATTTAGGNTAPTTALDAIAFYA